MLETRAKTVQESSEMEGERRAKWNINMREGQKDVNTDPQKSTFPTLFNKMSLHTTQPYQELCLLNFAQKPELVERLLQKKKNLD